jgi:hypothetical protein
MTPQVSVLMPVYNALPYLRPACDSVLSQTFGDFELIALDDASTDGSGEYLDGLTDPRVRVVHLPKAGYAVNLNVGLGLCRSPLVARMDADDVSYPERLARQVEMMDARPDVVACGCQADVIDANAKIVGGLRYETDELRVRYLLLTDSPLPHPGTTFRLAGVRAVGGYDPAKLPAEDYDLWCKLSARGKLLNLPHKLLGYRRHAANVSAKKEEQLICSARETSRRHLLEYGYAASAAEAEAFREAVIGRRTTLTPAGAAAVRAVWGRFLERHAAPAELRQWLRWQAMARAEACGPLSPAFFRWLRLARFADPAGMRWDRLAGRAMGKVAGAVRRLIRRSRESR